MRRDSILTILFLFKLQTKQIENYKRNMGFYCLNIYSAGDSLCIDELARK